MGIALAFAESDGRLSFVRMYLLRRHRSQLQALAAAYVHPARQLLVGDADGGPPSPARAHGEENRPQNEGAASPTFAPATIAAKRTLPPGAAGGAAQTLPGELAVP